MKDKPVKIVNEIINQNVIIDFLDLQNAKVHYLLDTFRINLFELTYIHLSILHL